MLTRKEKANQNLDLAIHNLRQAMEDIVYSDVSLAVAIQGLIDRVERYKDKLKGL